MKRNFLIILSLLSVSIFASSNSESLEKNSNNLKVVATTSIIGDVVKQVLQDNGELKVLMPVGKNPHSYTPAPRDIVALESADIIFVNGLDLEEQLIPVLESLNGPVIVEVSHGLEPRKVGHDEHDDDEHDDDEHDDDKHDDDEHDDDEHDDDEHDDDEHDKDEHDKDEHHEDDEHDHSAGDPHFWFSPLKVIHWVNEIEEALVKADPDNISNYQKSAEVYQNQLKELDIKIRELVKSINKEDRQLVMGHETLGYFADDYGFTILANILPSVTDQAEPSAREIAQVVEVVKEYSVRAIFVGGTAPKNVIKMAEAVAEENNISLPVVSLLSGSLTDSGRGSNYLDFVLYNTEQIVKVLKR